MAEQGLVEARRRLVPVIAVLPLVVLAACDRSRRADPPPLSGLVTTTVPVYPNARLKSHAELGTDAPKMWWELRTPDPLTEVRAFYRDHLPPQAANPDEEDRWGYTPEGAKEDEWVEIWISRAGESSTRIWISERSTRRGAGGDERARGGGVFSRSRFEGEGEVRVEQAVVVKVVGRRLDPDRMAELEDRLERAIRRAGSGEVDGHELDMEGRSGTVYLYGPSADALLDAVAPELATVEWLDEIVARVRYGPPGARERQVTIARRDSQPRSRAAPRDS